MRCMFSLHHGKEERPGPKTLQDLDPKTFVTPRPFTAAATAGDGWGTAILHAWTEADQAQWAGVLNFWFLGRVFDQVQP